jgi:hypothetical protein
MTNKTQTYGYEEDLIRERVNQRIRERNERLRELKSERPSFWFLLSYFFSDSQNVDTAIRNLCESCRISKNEIPELEAQLAFLDVRKKEKEGFDSSQYSPDEWDASHQGREAITCDGIVKRYDSIDLARILLAVRKVPFVRVCKRYYRTYEGNVQRGNE